MDQITIQDAILYAIDVWKFIGFTALLMLATFLIVYPIVSAARRLKRERDAENRRRKFDDRHQHQWH